MNNAILTLAIVNERDRLIHLQADFLRLELGDTIQADAIARALASAVFDLGIAVRAARDIRDGRTQPLVQDKPRDEKTWN